MPSLRSPSSAAPSGRHSARPLSTIGATSDICIDARWQNATPSGISSASVSAPPCTTDSLSAYFEHMSNAHTVSPDEDMDRLGICYGYRF